MARYDIAGRFWTGKKWEVWYLGVDSQKKLIGLLSVMVRELRFYQFSVTDHNQDSGDLESMKEKYEQLGFNFVEEGK